jgi:Na+/H+ antiporter NhaA
MIIVLILVFGGIALIEVPRLVQQQYWRELTVFSILLGIGFVLSVLIALGVPIPPIADTITKAFFTVVGKQG